MTATPSIDLPAWMVEQLSQASPDLLRQMVQTFPEWLLERRRRAESALVSVVATSYLLGVSTRRMEKLVETLGIARCRSRRRREGRRTWTPRWRRSGPGLWMRVRTRTPPRTRGC